MSWNIKDDKPPRVLPPAGNHLARCVWMIDCGTQTVSFPGSDPYDSRQVYISFELPTKKHEFKKENGPEPFMIGKTFNAYFGKKGTGLRGFLEEWKGKEYDDKSLKEQGVDLDKLVGVPCRLSLTHGETAKGAPKCTITGISRLDDEDKDRMPNAHNVRICLQLTKEAFNIRDWLNTPKWLQEICKKSPEYQRLERLGYTVEGGDIQEELEVETEFTALRKEREAERREFEAHEEAAANKELQILSQSNKDEEFEDRDVPF